MPRAGSSLYLTVDLCVRSLCAIIHRSTWKRKSAKFFYTEFSKVRRRVLGSLPHLWGRRTIRV
jgi:hypothetical protein